MRESTRMFRDPSFAVVQNEVWARKSLFLLILPLWTLCEELRTFLNWSSRLLGHSTSGEGELSLEAASMPILDRWSMWCSTHNQQRCCFDECQWTWEIRARAKALGKSNKTKYSAWPSKLMFDKIHPQDGLLSLVYGIDGCRERI